MTIQVATRSALRPTPRLMTIFSSLLVALATLAAAVASFQPFADPRLLFMDVIAGAQASGYCCRGYYGVMSSLGAVGWVLAAGVALFAALCLWTRSESATQYLPLAFGGALSLDAASFGDDVPQRLHRVGIAHITDRQKFRKTNG